ncbi:MAG: endonuclease III [candidate division Zixibacteria bacterium RBG_16_50_21]|nr:MAG: endonuclease III [candidate division Zixibacteria bacterium RBG_16_50_21]
MYRVVRESFEKKKTRTKKIIALLKREYPQAKCSLNFHNPLQLLVATRLSAQCTDARVNKVTQGLFRRYKTAQDFANASQRELEREVQSTGFFRAKANSIRMAARKMVEIFGGEVPRTMEEMLTLDGIGRKSANVILGNAYGMPSGIAVDTHVLRIMKRLGLSYAKHPEKMELDLLKLVPKKDWILFPHLVISHGRKICQARKPKCGECRLNRVCPSSLVQQFPPA